MKIVAISDTHGAHHKLTVPDGDLLLFAGDATNQGSLTDLANFNDWLGTLPHPQKVMIAGNHDWCFEREPDEARATITNAIYLEDEAVTLDGVKFYGSPFTPQFFDWAFMLERGPALEAKWRQIPDSIDVLITHGPPFGILDDTVWGKKAGCEALAARIAEIRPKYAVFGHIHEAYGQHSHDRTHFINASVVNLKYQVVNPPIVFEI